MKEGTARREGVLRIYLVALLGSERAGTRAERTLAELTAQFDGAGGTVAPDAGSVRKAAQTSGLDALEAEVQRLDRRIWRAATGRRQCRLVARRLRGRAEGRIPPAELDAFYRHLERCQTCAAITHRFDAGEWYLQGELGSINASRGSPASAPANEPVRPPPASPPVNPASGRSRRRSGVIVVLEVAGAAVAVGVTLVVTGVISEGETGPTPIHPLHISTTGASRIGGPGIGVRDGKVPFVAGGARFAIFVDPRQAWTGFARRVAPARGARWVLVTVGVRNLRRVGFDPRTLHYRLLVAGGANYFPDLARGTGPSVRRPAHPLAVGARAQVELAFQVPNSAAGLQLAFDPTGRHQRVVAALGQ